MQVTVKESTVLGIANFVKPCLDLRRHQRAGQQKQFSMGPCLRRWTASTTTKEKDAKEKDPKEKASHSPRARVGGASAAMACLVVDEGEAKDVATKERAKASRKERPIQRPYPSRTRTSLHLVVCWIKVDNNWKLFMSLEPLLVQKLVKYP